MTGRTLLAAMVIVAGCGTEGGPAQLDVQMLSVSGELGGSAITGASTSTVSGQREGDQGTFFVDGPDLTLQLSACPLGNLDTDPYGLGGEPGGGPRPVPVPDDAGVGVQGGTVGGVDCFGRGLTLCASGSCGQFASDEVELSIVEENGWRHLTADASGGSGAVRVELRYRETH